MISMKGRIATVGMFDGVHLGHRSLIGELICHARRLRLEPVVFTFDRHPLTLISPGSAPASLASLNERVAFIRSAGVSDVEVLTFDPRLRALDARGFITMLRDRYDVRALLMGFNHRFGSDRLTDFGDYEAIGVSLGVAVIRASEWRREAFDGEICSSGIRRALKDGDVRRAAMMLGRPYTLAGEVTGGRRLGRRLGFPTANIVPAWNGQQIPATGVYAVDVTMPDGTVRRGMVNIGYRPTVDRSDDPALSVEVHVIGWNGDLYGKTLKLAFLSRLRGEMRFDGVDALKEQLSRDRDDAIDA